MVERGVVEREVGVAGMEAMASATETWCILRAAGGGMSERTKGRTGVVVRGCWTESYGTLGDSVALAQNTDAFYSGESN